MFEIVNLLLLFRELILVLTSFVQRYLHIRTHLLKLFVYFLVICEFSI